MTDCDDVVLLVARGRAHWSEAEAATIAQHAAGCEICASLVDEGATLPAVDPERFVRGATIAAGGMGQIRRGHDRRLGRVVALKEVLAPALRARFEREAQITARLQHPAIVPVYDAGTWPDGTPFYAMRLVEGETLAAAIDARTTLGARLELLPHLVAATEAVAYAHAHGVIHRDVKPTNVLVGAFGETVVIDWGLAKLTGDAEVPLDHGGEQPAALTHAGTVIGTPCFMAPEQARGEDADERADVFALGALLYHVLVGSPPYWDSSHESGALIEAVLTRPPTAIMTLAPAAPADLRAIVERAMAREASARFANAGELAAELRRFAAGQLLVSREYRVRDLIARWIRKHRALVTIGGAAALVAIVAGTVAVRSALRARAAEREAATAFERGQRKLCEASAPELDGPWTPAARDLVHRRVAHLDLAFGAQTLQRIDAGFTRWSQELAAARDGACAGGTPRSRLAAELACLADRTREARALVGQLQDGDKMAATNAIAAIDGLGSPARCAELAVDKPVASSEEVTAVRTLFSKAYALTSVGKVKDSLPIAKEAVARADAIGDTGLRAAARVSLGSALSQTGDIEGAVAMLRAAVELADIARDDRSRAQAWTNLVRIEYQRGRPEQAIALEGPARGATARFGDVFLETEVLLFVGGALGQVGKNDEARKRFEEAVARRKAAYGGQHRLYANALSSLGNAAAMSGDLDAGIAAHAEAAKIGAVALGDQHPGAAVLRSNLASDYLYAKRYPEAIQELEAAMAITRASYGDSHRDIAMALTNIGTAQYLSGARTEAVATFTRAIELWRVLGPKHPMLGEALVGKALALGKSDVPELEAAVELEKGLPPFIRARGELALAKAVGGARGRTFADAAIKGFETSTLPLTRDELADARAWLVGAK